MADLKKQFDAAAAAEAMQGYIKLVERVSRG